MLNSKLNNIKKEFRQHMAKSFELIQIANTTSPPFPKDKIYLVYELSFLKFFLAWEWFIENTFILYMLGKKTNRGYRPKTYAKPKDEEHAYEFVREGRDYADWTSPDAIKRKAKVFFKGGEPYESPLTSVIKDIQDMKTIRNAIVHMSQESQKRFETLLREKLGHAKAITPGEFLSHDQSTNLTYIAYFSDRLEFASDQIVK